MLTACIRRAALGLIVVALTACGFHLRGAQPMPFESLYLEMSNFSELGASIRRQLRANGTRVPERREDAEVRLVVVQDAKEKHILTLNAAGTVREYQLRQRFSFRLMDAKGGEVMPLNEIYVYRDISFNDAQTLAKEQEEGLLYRDMENDLVQQLMRRLAAAKPR